MVWQRRFNHCSHQWICGGSLYIALLFRVVLLGRWIICNLKIPFYPPQQELEDFSPQACEELIFKLVGHKLVDITVVDIKPWVMHAEVAENFVSCGNRVMLAGDAAHRFPPAGGFGMNTGIQDAHNLSWKIAFLLKGIASPSILKTYEMERRPIAIFNTELSIQNFKAAMSVPAALGLSPTIANSVHGVINSGFGSLLPSALQKAVLEGVFAIGRAQLSQSLLNEKNPLGSLRLAKLRSIFYEGKSLQLQFPAEDLGFRFIFCFGVPYFHFFLLHSGNDDTCLVQFNCHGVDASYLKGALVPDVNDEEWDARKVPIGRRRDYVASSKPGSRLPHMNVRVLKASNGEEMLSTLDLISGDKLEFVLIIAPIKESYELGRVAFKVADGFNVLLKVCIIWPQCSFNQQTDGSQSALAPWQNYIDVEEVKRSSSASSWWDMCQMTKSGAILVRPDEHIAWRAKSAVVGDPLVEMDATFSLILGMKKLDAREQEI